MTSRTPPDSDNTLRRIGGRLIRVAHPQAEARPPVTARPIAQPQIVPSRLRDPRDPLAPHFEPDFEPPPGIERDQFVFDLRPTDHLRDFPVPVPFDTTPACTPQWNSIALFYNLDIPATDRPSDYTTTSVDNARDFLDEGANPLAPTISESLCRYWGTLSYGNFAFGLDTPRDGSGNPLIPTITPAGNDAQAWEDMIRKCLDEIAAEAWAASGSLVKDGKRWIPSVVLVQKYWTHASARFGSYEQIVDGETYLIGDRTHIRWGLDQWSPTENPGAVGRTWWSTLNHEYAHNFLEFGDLYGPQGCTGYWDLLGDNSPPGRMSEVSSIFKHQVGWLDFKGVIEGPIVASSRLSLQPYTSTGEAYKVVPDPAHTPHEYFLLEFRGSLGNEVWRPDGGLPESGLLITHINERLGVAGTWLLREAPFFDPEFADDPRRGYVDWTGHDDLANKLFPNGSRNSFTKWTTPTSRLYGGRDSGLSIINIAVSSGTCTFDLAINCSPQVGWNVTDRDRAHAGRFTADSPTGGEQIILRDDDNAALLVHREAQWLVNRVEHDWIGDWNLGGDNREHVGDLDGDGLDEIFIRSPNWAGVLKYQGGRFRSVTVEHDWIDDWNLGNDNWEHIADLDGDGQAEIYVRSPDWAGVFKLIGGRLRNLRLHHDWIDDWNLGVDDEEFVGRFTQADRDEIAIRSPNWLGLLAWDDSLSQLRLLRLQHDWVDGWNLGGDNWHVVGDFDGDGLDEIFVRSPRWAGLMKWQGGRFRTIWMTSDFVEHRDGREDHRWQLAADQGIYSGRFRSDRDGVLTRDDGWGVAVLAWDGSAITVQRRMKSRFGGRWNLGAGDRFVLGDFHRVGTDVADTMNQPVIDGLTDVFIHNGWGSAMIGVNHGPWNPAGDVLDQMGLTWIQQGILMDED